MNAEVRVGVPSKGRLREQTIELLGHAGYRVSGAVGPAARSTEGIEFIEMRPGDAAAWLAAGRLDAAFISTDTALENELEKWPTLELGFARSTLMIACREQESWQSASDLEGRTVATHLPDWTNRWFRQQGINASVVHMGGALEGVCAVGMADAIVDLRETGGSLHRNRLRVLQEIQPCQATLVSSPDTESPEISLLRLRVTAAVRARSKHYLMLHIDSGRVDELIDLFPGLDSPTVLPLAGREGRVAAHMVVDRNELWSRLAELQSIGATDIVALPTYAIT